MLEPSDLSSRAYDFVLDKVVFSPKSRLHSAIKEVLNKILYYIIHNYISLFKVLNMY